MNPRSTTTLLAEVPSRPLGRLGVINGILLVALAACLVWYLAQVNGLASTGWRVRELQTQLTDVQSRRDMLIADAVKFDDQKVLEQLAQNAGLVPAGSVAYVIQAQPVAAR